MLSFYSTLELAIFSNIGCEIQARPRNNPLIPHLATDAEIKYLGCKGCATSYGRSAYAIADLYAGSQIPVTSCGKRRAGRLSEANKSVRNLEKSLAEAYHDLFPFLNRSERGTVFHHHSSHF